MNGFAEKIANSAPLFNPKSKTKWTFWPGGSLWARLRGPMGLGAVRPVIKKDSFTDK
jgi:hypothetical protein